MEENNKVIIFEKKEIFLILVLVVILLITSFTIGINLGKKLGLTKSGVKQEDIQSAEYKSVDEEEADKTFSDESKLSDEEKLQKLKAESELKLQGQLDKFTKNETILSEEKSSAPKPEVIETSSSPEFDQKSLSGKFTIQLGSYNTIEEAEKFAEGFTARGYTPIINQASLPDKGDWFRVSLGTFNSIEEAKSYIKSQESLFSGQDHVIVQFP